LKEFNEREAMHKAHAYVLKTILDDFEKNGGKQCAEMSIQGWLKLAESQKRSNQVNQKSQKLGMVDDREVAEYVRLQREIDRKRIEKEKLLKLMEANKALWGSRTGKMTERNISKEVYISKGVGMNTEKPNSSKKIVVAAQPLLKKQISSVVQTPTAIQPKDVIIKKRGTMGKSSSTVSGILNK